MHPYHEAARPSGERTLTVFLPSGPLVVNSDHPSYDEILAGAKAQMDAQELFNLVDLSQVVSEKFSPLSERVSVSGGTVYFDGDAVHSALADHIVRALDDGSDFTPLVRFYEKLASNPNPHSREQLYDWLNRRDFTITPDGDLLAYKGCGGTPEQPLSGWSGTAIVNGETVTGKIPNVPGSTVEMPRSRVQHDPATACSTGLHTGTFAYARGYASGVLLLVKVNPRDVVSVPTDAAGEKVRVSRYVVVDSYTAPEPIQSAVYSWDEEGFDPYDAPDEDEGCGDPDCEYC